VFRYTFAVAYAELDQVEYCAAQLQHKIRAYQTETEEQARRAQWWDIKEWLGNYNTAIKHGLEPERTLCVC
jgi:hypothetical protein